jgi:hypothetical protein
VKSKVGSPRNKMRKKVAKRAAPKKTKRKSGSTKSRTGLGKQKQTRSRQQKKPLKLAVGGTTIDVVDEPAPGVLRVTEIEEINVGMFGSEEDDKG